MDDEKYFPAFQLIEHAGDAESDFMLCMEKAQEEDYAAAQEEYDKGCAALKEAHQLQTDMMQNEANGEPVDINVIMVHAQDHLAMAILLKNQAAQIMALCKKITALTEKPLRIKKRRRLSC